jgi:hypothetical protein
MPDVKNRWNPFSSLVLFIVLEHFWLFSTIFLSRVRFTVWSFFTVSAILTILASVHLSPRFEKGIGDQKGLDSVQAVLTAFKRIWSDSILSLISHRSSDPIWTRTWAANENSQLCFSIGWEKFSRRRQNWLLSQCVWWKFVNSASSWNFAGQGNSKGELALMATRHHFIIEMEGSDESQGSVPKNQKRAKPARVTRWTIIDDHYKKMCNTRCSQIFTIHSKKSSPGMDWVASFQPNPIHRGIHCCVDLKSIRNVAPIPLFTPDYSSSFDESWSGKANI